MSVLNSEPIISYLLLGNNLGDQESILTRARILISLHIGAILSISKLYETAPWGELDQANFLNQAISIKTRLAPEELMQAIIKIEKILGKEKRTKWGPRTIDIDILLYNNDIINQANLEIPHPRMLSRNFVLIPLSEIAEEVIHPIAKKSIKELVGMCIDKGEVGLYKGKSI
ncbi:UNVERIFIED_CONTAM: hypothetical protein GTU68_031856 [Idotea baltica]|nr:hypothetical protein [Idotea baltica]